MLGWKSNRKVPSAAMLEEVILGKSKNKFTQRVFKLKARSRWIKALELIQKKRKKKLNGTNSIWWWEPSKQKLPVEFCKESSMHGLYHIVQSKRHLTER